MLEKYNFFTAKMGVRGVLVGNAVFRDLLHVPLATGAGDQGGLRTDPQLHGQTQPLLSELGTGCTVQVGHFSMGLHFWKIVWNSMYWKFAPESRLEIFLRDVWFPPPPPLAVGSGKSAVYCTFNPPKLDQ